MKAEDEERGRGSSDRRVAAIGNAKRHQFGKKFNKGLVLNFNFVKA